MTGLGRQGQSPPLEPRFLPPPGWQWHTFKNSRGQTLRFGMVLPPGGKPEAIVVGLQGLREFAEKYFEVSHDMLARNMGFFMMDWHGQGESQRYLANPQKRHSDGFDNDVADLHEFIESHVKPALAERQMAGVPLVMLAHSMGSNIGMRYLHRHPDAFACAAFSAPFTGIYALRNLSTWASLRLTASFKRVMGECYVTGGHDWKTGERGISGKSDFSHDPARDDLHAFWYERQPSLQTGHVTFGWVHEANLSCARLQDPAILKDINTPCLLVPAGQEVIVDNKTTRHAAAHMPNAKFLELQEAKHEILMERDDIRNRFFGAFDQLLETHKIKSRPTPP